MKKSKSVRAIHLLEVALCFSREDSLCICFEGFFYSSGVSLDTDSHIMN